MTKRLTEVRRFSDGKSWVVDILGNRNAVTGYVRPDGTAGMHYDYGKKSDAIVAEALYLAKNAGGHNGIETSAGAVAKRTCGDCDRFRGSNAPCDKSTPYSPEASELVNLCPDFEPRELKTFVNGAKGEIRKFDTGATRDTVEGKLDYVKALCPLVLRRYVQYLDKHRLQPDGSMRDFDNWKKGIPRETYHSSKGRHFFADWLLEEGYEVSDNHGPVDEEDALCGELFNLMGKLHEILKAKLQSKKE